MELASYQTERLFWERLGVPASVGTLDVWPEQKIRRYLIVMDQEAKYQKVQEEVARREAEARSRQTTKGR